MAATSVTQPDPAFQTPELPQHVTDGLNAVQSVLRQLSAAFAEAIPSLAPMIDSAAAGAEALTTLLVEDLPEAPAQPEAAPALTVRNGDTVRNLLSLAAQFFVNASSGLNAVLDAPPVPDRENPVLSLLKTGENGLPRQPLSAFPGLADLAASDRNSVDAILRRWAGSGDPADRSLSLPRSATIPLAGMTSGSDTKGAAAGATPGAFPGPAPDRETDQNDLIRLIQIFRPLEQGAAKASLEVLNRLGVNPEELAAYPAAADLTAPLQNLPLGKFSLPLPPPVAGSPAASGRPLDNRSSPDFNFAISVQNPAATAADLFRDIPLAVPGPYGPTVI